MTLYELARIKHPLSGIRRRGFISGAKAVIQEIEITLSENTDEFLRENIEKLIKELKGN